MDRGLDLTSQAEATHFWFRGFRQFVAPVIGALAGPRRDLRLIDCGCGTGCNLALLAPYGRVCGFDLTHWGAVRTRASGRPVARADITRIPFVSGRFDVATSFDVLQCVEADELAVREMTRIVKPGGAIVLTVAAFDWLRGDHAISWNERRRYTPSKARRLVEQAGLHAERVSFMFASVFPVIAAARFAQRVLRPIRGVRDDADMTVPAAPINAALTTLVTGEAALARRGWRMPIGSSILVVARKP
jgi:SAM-dependent methyltransferase